MSYRLFLCIAQDFEREKPYFQQTCDASGKMRLTAIQKCTSALSIPGYDKAANINDNYLKNGEKTTRHRMKKV